MRLELYANRPLSTTELTKLVKQAKLEGMDELMRQAPHILHEVQGQGIYPAVTVQAANQYIAEQK